MKQDQGGPIETADRGDDALDPTQQQFVKRLMGGYTPPPLTAARRVALDAALEARLTRRPWRWTPTLATAAVALVAAWWILPQVSAPEAGAPSLTRPTAVPGPQLARTDASARWQYELMEVELETPGDERLPQDYRAIASAFLDI